MSRGRVNPGPVVTKSTTDPTEPQAPASGIVIELAGACKQVLRMMKQRLIRRCLGWAGKRIGRLGLESVEDQRKRVRRWRMAEVLTGIIAGMVTGCTSLKDVEAFTAALGPASRRVLGLRGRLPDTSARDVVIKLGWECLRRVLHRHVRESHRSKRIGPVGLPFGVVAMDGKATALKAVRKPDPRCLQPQETESGEYGLLRTVTSVLVSSRARPVIDTHPIASHSNEMDTFGDALRHLVAAYGRLNLFQVVSYDAGACSKSHGRLVREHGLDYFFRLKAGAQPKLGEEAEDKLASLGPEQALATSAREQEKGSTVVRRVWVVEGVDHWPTYAGARTLVRVEREVTHRDGQVERHSRYSVSSLPLSALTGNQWLMLLRIHWGVENNGHHTLDTVFEEDEHPWVPSDAAASLALMFLRRIAYNLLTLWRSVSQRSEAKRRAPWRSLQRDFEVALLTGTLEDALGLPRARSPG